MVHITVLSQAILNMHRSSERNFFVNGLRHNAENKPAESL